jgi:iron complex outermembrane receptor protein
MTLLKTVAIYLFFITFWTSAISAQNTLTIRDIESNKIVDGATVISLPDSLLFISGDEGKVAIKGLETGSILAIKYIGYKSSTYQLLEGDNTIFLSPDYQQLNSLSVVGYENNERLYEIAGSYIINSTSTMGKFNDESLVRSTNTLPGIRFEERSPNSYRISIRGNLLRAPYGVRNVKVYLNSIPYTDPAGGTAINLLDMNNIGKVEILKGPAGSRYGAGIGGVLNISSEVNNVKRLSADVGIGLGSFDYQKIVANVNSGNEDYRFSIRFANQKADGYRDHTNTERSVVQMSASLYTSKKRSLTAQILFSDLFYQTPGGLTQAQYDEDPKQARPGAADKNASIYHQSFFAGLVQDYKWSKKFQNSTSIYLTNGVKENPFLTNYQRDKLSSYGGRTTFDFNLHIAQLPLKLSTGAEINYGLLKSSNHGNLAGNADTLRYKDEIQSLQSFIFFHGDLNLTEKWILSGGVSVNFYDVDINRLEDVARDTSYHIDRRFDPEFIPRIGIVGILNDQFSLHGSISVGFSPPTVDEISTSDGGINTDLNPEKGISYEIGIRGNNKNNKLYYDLSTFWMQQKETIVSKSTEMGNVVFENAGSTAQWGLEFMIGYAIINNPSKVLSFVKIQTAYTYHNFIFKDYVKRKGSENVDYSGNELTGTAPNISVTTFDLELKQGFYFTCSYNYTDRIPLNDANTVYGDSYQLVTAKAGWKINLKEKHLMEVFIGVDNLLNEKYSLGNDLNPFGGRYFNAAPIRNYYGGLKIYFNAI